MKRLSVTALVLTIVLATSIWAPPPAAAQTPVQRGRSIDLLFYSTAGTSTVAFGATYPFGFVLDGTLNYASAGGTSTVSLGARYWFPLTAAGLTPYVGGGISFLSGATSQTGLYVGGGATVGLSPQLTGYAGINFGNPPPGALSTSAGTTTSFDVGVQYLFASHFGGVIGLTGSGGSSSLYLGATLNY